MTILRLCYPRSFQVMNALLSKLTLPAPCISERYIKIKIKTFIKPFETPQRSVKVKIQVTFFSLSGIRAGRIYKKLSNLHQLHHQFFLNFDMVLETHMMLCVKVRDFPEKTFLLPKLRKWFFEFIEKICSIMKTILFVVFLHKSHIWENFCS